MAAIASCKVSNHMIDYVVSMYNSLEEGQSREIILKCMNCLIAWNKMIDDIGQQERYTEQLLDDIIQCQFNVSNEVVMNMKNNSPVKQLIMNLAQFRRNDITQIISDNLAGISDIMSYTDMHFYNEPSNLYNILKDLI